MDVPSGDAKKYQTGKGMGIFHRKKINLRQKCYIYNKITGRFSLRRVSDAVSELILENPLLHFGYYHQLLNLSQVARFLHPVVEARTLKDVQVSAIHMALSRMRKTLPPATGTPESFMIDKINIHTGLCSCTWLKTTAAHRELNRLYDRILQDHGFITITEGMSEMTAIIAETHYELAIELIKQTPRHVYRSIAAVGIKFHERHLTEPGLIYQLVQQVALQRLNLIEVTSTATEFNMYLAEDEVQLAFESLYSRFMKRRR